MTHQPPPAFRGITLSISALGNAVVVAHDWIAKQIFSHRRTVIADGVTSYYEAQYGRRA